MAPEGEKRRLAAILIADAAGYSRLVAADEVETVRRFRASADAIAERIREYGGRVVDAVGDNLLAEFPSSVDAVAAAVEVQRDSARINAHLPAERKMLFRIGVSLGDVISEQDHIAGHAVNIAARLQGFTEPGGIAVLGAVFDAVQRALPLEFVKRGVRPIKNMPPVRVYQVVVPRTGEAMPREGQLTAWKLRRPFASPRMLIGALAVAVLGIVLIAAAPPERLRASLVEGGSGFSLLFVYLFFRYGIERIPLGQRSFVTVVIVILLFGFMTIQARGAVVALASLFPEEPPESMADGLPQGGTVEAESPTVQPKASERISTVVPEIVLPWVEEVLEPPTEGPREGSPKPEDARTAYPSRRSSMVIPFVRDSERCLISREPVLEPELAVRWTLEEVLVVLANPDLSDEERHAALVEVSCGFYDFSTISRLVVARSWEEFSPEQRNEFVDQFAILLSRTYGSRVTRYQPEQVAILGSRVEPRGDVTVRTQIEGGPLDGVRVDYRLRKRKGPWLAIDVIIEGVSLVSSCRAQFKQILDRGGPEELLTKLRERNFSLALEDDES